MPLVIRSLFKKHFFTPFSLILGLSSLFYCEAQAIMGKESQNVLYYKDFKSEFPSGQASIETLKKNLISNAYFSGEKESSFYIYGEQKISKSLLKPTFAKDLSTDSLCCDNYADIGLFLVLSSTPLKTEPKISSTTLSTIPKMQKLKPLGYKNGYVLVKYNTIKGYIDITSTLSKFDYARAVYATVNGKPSWNYVKARVFDQIYLTNGSSVSLNEVKGLLINSNLGFITQTDDQLPLWSKVELKKTNEKNWRKSYIDGHGVVWWTEPKDTEKNQTVKIDDLLKNEVYSVSFHPKNPKKAIASTDQGVFITQNGESWTEITSFKTYKGPVLYYSDNLIFVGTYKSIDKGQTFNNFLNVNTLSESLRKKLGYQPSAVKIKSLKAADGLKLLVELDTGIKTLKLRSAVYSSSWDLISSN